jgi:hypothetical protein
MPSLLMVRGVPSTRTLRFEFDHDVGGKHSEASTATITAYSVNKPSNKRICRNTVTRRGNPNESSRITLLWLG